MPSPSTIFVIVIIILVCVGTLGMVLLKVAERLAFHRAGVSPFEEEWGEEDDDRTSSIAPVQRVEPQKTIEAYQAEPREPSQDVPPADPLIISHKMSRKELTILLAAQKTDEGAYRWSANKIADFVGGTSAEVKGWVADVRGRKEPAATSLRRPANGWGR